MATSLKKESGHSSPRGQQKPVVHEDEKGETKTPNIIRVRYSTVKTIEGSEDFHRPCENVVQPLLVVSIVERG